MFSAAVCRQVTKLTTVAMLRWQVRIPFSMYDDIRPLDGHTAPHHPTDSLHKKKNPGMGEISKCGGGSIWCLSNLPGSISVRDVVENLMCEDPDEHCTVVDRMLGMEKVLVRTVSHGEPTLPEEWVRNHGTYLRRYILRSTPEARRSNVVLVHCIAEHPPTLHDAVTNLEVMGFPIDNVDTVFTAKPKVGSKAKRDVHVFYVRMKSTHAALALVHDGVSSLRPWCDALYCAETDMYLHVLQVAREEWYTKKVKVAWSEWRVRKGAVSFGKELRHFRGHAKSAGKEPWCVPEKVCGGGGAHMEECVKGPSPLFNTRSFCDVGHYSHLAAAASLASDLHYQLSMAALAPLGPLPPAHYPDMFYPQQQQQLPPLVQFGVPQQAQQQMVPLLVPEWDLVDGMCKQPCKKVREESPKRPASDVKLQWTQSMPAATTHDVVPDFKDRVFCHSEERARDDKEATLGSRSSAGSEGVSDSVGLELESTGDEAESTPESTPAPESTALTRTYCNQAAQTLNCIVMKIAPVNA